MKLPQRITAEWLIKNGACDVDRFRHLFPRGAAVTIANAKKAIDAGLDVYWLLERLPRSARAEYDRVAAPALAEYDRVAAPARAEYEKAIAAALVKVWDEWSKEGGGE